MCVFCVCAGAVGSCMRCMVGIYTRTNRDDIGERNVRAGDGDARNGERDVGYVNVGVRVSSLDDLLSRTGDDMSKLNCRSK